MIPTSMRSQHAVVLAALMSSTVALSACSSGMEGKPAAEVKDEAGADASPEADVTGAADEAGTTAIDVDVQASKIGFRGAKVTGGHDGGFEKFTGRAKIVGDTPKSVEFEIDMNSTWSDAEKLTKHLIAPDFFDVAKYPTSTFVSSKIEPKSDGEYTHVITGELDLHGKKKSISFPAKVEVSDGALRGTTEFKINRKDFDIVYPGMPDDLIKDEVLIKLDLTFPKA